MNKKIGLKIFFSFLFAIPFGLFLRFNQEFLFKIGFNFDILRLTGDVFMNLIKLISIPLVFFCIIDSIVSIDNSNSKSSNKKTIIKAITLFFITTVFFVFLGLISINIFKIGENIIIKDQIQSNVNYVFVQQVGQKLSDYSFKNFILDMIPSNIFEAFLRGNFLQIIFVAILTGYSILKVEEDTLQIKVMIKSFTNIVMKTVLIVMNVAPIGVFGSTCWLFATQDFLLIQSLVKFIFFHYLNTLFILYIVYGSFILLFLKLNPIIFFKKIIPAQILAYFTSSTAASMPLGMKIAKEKLGISDEKVNLIMPLAMTVNMNGGAFYLGSCTVFLAQVFGVKLTFYKYLTIVVMSIFSSIATAPVPGASLLLLASIITAVGIPIEAMSLIFPIDRILDMMRSVANLTGDVFATLFIDKKDKTFNKDIYYQK